MKVAFLRFVLIFKTLNLKKKNCNQLAVSVVSYSFKKGFHILTIFFVKTKYHYYYFFF